MEYDRALYRVYEHIMEDLNSSSPPFSSSTAPLHRSSSTASSTATPNQNQAQASAAAMLPLFLPACASPFIEVFLNAMENRRGGAVRGVCSVDFMYRIWRVCLLSIRGATATTTGGGEHFNNNGENEDDEEEEDENGIVMSSGRINHNNFMMRRLRRGNGHVRLATSDDAINEENVGNNGSTGSSSNGLRRRGNSTASHSSHDGDSQDSPSSDSEHSGESSSSSSSSLSLSSASSSSSREGEEEEDNDNLPTSAALAQNVARSQTSRNRRHRHRHNNNRQPNNNNNNTTQPQIISQNQNRQEGGGGGGCTQKGLYNLMRFTLFLGIFHLVVLKCLHDTYVGSLMKKNQIAKRFASKRRMLVEEEEKEDRMATCIEYALSTRPVESRGAYFHMFGDASSSDDDSSDDELLAKTNDTKTTTTTTPEKENEKPEKDPPLLGKDEILQIKILYGGECVGQCSRVHTTTILPNTNNTTTSTTTNKKDVKRKLQSYVTQEWSYTNPGLDHYLPSSNSQKEEEEDEEENNKLSVLETEEYWKEPHYRFSTSEALLYLDKRMVLLHNVTLVNVTVTERCLSVGSDQGSATYKTKLSEIFSQIYGIDSAVVNQLMYGIKTSDGEYRNGHVQNMETKERWSWNKELLKGFDEESGNVFSWFFVKIGDLALAILSFFLIMSVTALIVRVLTTSGVVVMFPLFACFRACGLPGADDRILNLSYSWIGRARNAIDRRGIHTSWHLIGAHMGKIFLYYIMYEACQAAWSVVLYSKSVPAAMPVWVYAFAMIWEYFSMVFVRSVLSVYFFPRIIFLYFILFHLYFYSVPYGYYDVALIPLFLFSVQAMIYTLIALEAPAAARGAVSMECPREVYNRLSWPEWSASIPNEWTLFLPVNSRYTPLYDQEVEDVEGNNVDDANEEETGEENGAADEDGDENDMNDDTPSTLSVPLGSEDVRAESDNLVGRDTDALSESDPINARSGLHSRRGIAQH